MLLSDGTIRQLLENGGLTIDPMPTDERFQPASVDLTLSNHFRHASDMASGFYLDTYYLPSGGFVLGTTAEKVKLGGSLAGTIKGKSTLARTGLMVECAGFVDPGFSGQLTLEFFNFGTSPIPLTAGMTVAQIRFDFLDYPSERPYGTAGLNSHYQDQSGATAARYGWRCEASPGGMRCARAAVEGKRHCRQCEETVL